MVRENITKLSLPPDDFRPDLAAPDVDGKSRFQTLEDVLAEDETRIRMIGKALELRRLCRKERRLAEKLLKRLKKGLRHPGSTDSLASAVRAREYRIRVIGWLRHVAYLESCKPDGRWSTFHMIPPDWVYKSEELWEVNPKNLIGRIRRRFNDGTQMPEGWLFAGLHGEFDPMADVWRLHLHGAASHQLLNRLDELRGCRSLTQSEANQAAAPIRITRKKINDPLRALSYCLQLWWPLRASADEETNEAIRLHGRRRIPDPHHTRMLLWLDRQSLPDLTLRIGLRVSKGALCHD